MSDTSKADRNENSPCVAIIGGTGLTSLANLTIVRREMVNTPFGEASGPITHGLLCGKPVAFLPRHGYGHTIPPHRVNYRANIWALRHIGAPWVIAVAAVGGIRNDMEPGQLAFPDQIIDYTWGRPHTFFEENLSNVTHVDFTKPYSSDLRQKLIAASRLGKLDAREDGTYGATQGPRLESAAEIRRMERDGCDLVGMTGMPEVGLAREAGLSYATCSAVVNWAAGKGGDSISMEDIESNLVVSMEKVRTLLETVIPEL